MLALITVITHASHLNHPLGPSTIGRPINDIPAHPPLHRRGVHDSGARTPDHDSERSQGNTKRLLVDAAETVERHQTLMRRPASHGQFVTNEECSVQAYADEYPDAGPRMRRPASYGQFAHSSISPRSNSPVERLSRGFASSGSFGDGYEYSDERIRDDHNDADHKSGEFRIVVETDGCALSDFDDEPPITPRTRTLHLPRSLGPVLPDADCCECGFCHRCWARDPPAKRPVSSLLDQGCLTCTICEEASTSAAKMLCCTVDPDQGQDDNVCCETCIQRYNDSNQNDESKLFMTCPFCRRPLVESQRPPIIGLTREQREEQHLQSAMKSQCEVLKGQLVCVVIIVICSLIGFTIHEVSSK